MNYKKWTKEDIKIIEENYNKLTPKQLSYKLDRSLNSVYQTLHKLKLRSIKRWTNTDLKLLKDNYSKLMPKQLVSKFFPNRSIAQVRDKAEKLKLISYKMWTKKDIKYLKENYAYGTWEDLTKNLNRTKATIVAYARNFSLVKETRPNKPWAKKDIEFLKKNYARMPMLKLVHELERPKNLIIYVANNRGLVRDARAGSSLEEQFEVELQKMTTKYEIQKKVWKYKVDFVVGDVAIELQGTYWHCDSRVYKNGPKYDTQRKTIVRDKRKKECLKSKGYRTVIIWEYDFYNDWENVKNKLSVVLNGDIEDYDSANTVKPEKAIPC